MPIANHATSVPVVVDDEKCIAHKGCKVCVEVCPLDVLAIDESQGQGLHEIRRVLVLHAVRGGLPDRRGHGQHSLSAAVSPPWLCSTSLDSDLDDIAARCADDDAGVRRVAMLELAEVIDDRRGAAAGQGTGRCGPDGARGRGQGARRTRAARAWSPRWSARSRTRSRRCAWPPRKRWPRRRMPRARRS